MARTTAAIGRIYRLEHDGAPRHAIETDGELRLVDGDIFGAYTLGRAVERGRLLAPVTPSKIVAVGLNYRDHAIETGKPLPEEPLIFIKPSTAVIGPAAAIRLPAGVGRVDYEAEVGVVIGRVAHRVTRDRAREHILGVTCVNDVTARVLQKKDGQFTRAKGFDTFAPVGPCIAPYTGASLAIEGWVNGERRQRSSTRELIFPVDVLVEFVTRVMTLLPGDIISTGTPSGIGPLESGDTVAVTVETVGELVNPVVDE
jgi:2-keto-4-pentenoate hydratase/2-oxohepta-3-ene-1,7-dioic acid hydratase in catechol pathway